MSFPPHHIPGPGYAYPGMGMPPGAMGQPTMMPMPMQHMMPPAGRWSNIDLSFTFQYFF